MTKRLCVGAAAIVLGATASAGAQEAAADNGQPSEPGSIAIDRWLVSHSYSTEEHARTVADYLGVFEDVEFFPDRGRRVGTTIWTLERHDSIATFDLDELFDERIEGGLTFAHAYIWVPGGDRTLRLALMSGCHPLRIVFNAHGLPGRDPDASPASPSSAFDGDPQGCPAAGVTDTVDARFAAGWNSLLVGVDSGDGPYTFGVEILPGREDALNGLRVQASRPPGVRQAIAEPWITIPRFGIQPQLVWHQDELAGVLEYVVVPWGRGPRGKVELELEIAKFKLKGDLTSLRPLTPTTLRALVPYEDLRRAATGEGQVRMTLKWEDVERRVEPSIPAAGIVERAGRPVRLIGWRVPGALGDELTRSEVLDTPGPPLPTGESEPRAAEWKVPELLAGTTLTLEVDGAPGRYRLNGADHPAPSGPIAICGGCKKGERLLIEAVSSGGWDNYPTVAVSWAGSRAGDPSAAASPEAWLKALR